MRLILIILLLSSFLVQGQKFLVRGQNQIKLKIKPKLVGKPSTLDECYKYLDKIFDDTSKYNFKVFPEKFAVNREQIILGGWMRDEWGLWTHSDLKSNFEKLGIYLPEDMSKIILTSYHRRLNKNEIDIDEQIKNCHKFYKHLTASGDSIFYNFSPKELEEGLAVVKGLFNVGDTVIIPIDASEKRFFRINEKGVTGFAVVRDKKYDNEQIVTEIIKIRADKKKIPNKKIGDVTTLDLLG